MTDIERELITLIRENENPEQALLTAVLIIGSFLEQSLSFQAPTKIAFNINISNPKIITLSKALLLDPQSL